jgi:hypothetical protein
VERWNATAVRLGPILDAVMHTRDGRFHHDPAEWSPTLRATKRFTLPGLSQAEALPQLAGRPEQGFLKAPLTRAVNGARSAIREAMRELRAA